MYAKKKKKINLSTVAISHYQVTLIKLIVDYNIKGGKLCKFLSLVSLHDNFIRQFNYFYLILFLCAFIEGIYDTIWYVW